MARRDPHLSEPVLRPDKPISALQFNVYRNYRAVHGVRIALAFVLTFLLVRLMEIPEGSWPLITLVVVICLLYTSPSARDS